MLDATLRLGHLTASWRRGGIRSMPARRRETFAERRERKAAVDDPAVVLDAATRFLEARARSVAEVRRRLTAAGYRPELIDDAIVRLADLGFLDDEAFARSWIESRERARPRGEGALRRELQLKGVDRSIVDALLEERREARGSAASDGLPAEGGSGGAAGDVAPDVERDAARRLLERHRRNLERVADPRARRQRAYALLARNGFDSDTASEVSRGFVAPEERGLRAPSFDPNGRRP